MINRTRAIGPAGPQCPRMCSWAKNGAPTGQGGVEAPLADEPRAFPKRARDDQVDAASAAFRAPMRRATWHAAAA
jgi:hypothetical protein